MDFLNWIKALISRPNEENQLHPERLTFVTFDESSVRTTCKTSPSGEMLWSSVTSIWLRTTSDGPYSPDVWWILVDETAEMELHFPQGATGENAVLEEIGSRFEGFTIDRMNSTKDAQFPLWQKKPNLYEE